jgi:hypothetical protein
VGGVRNVVNDLTVDSAATGGTASKKDPRD